MPQKWDRKFKPSICHKSEYTLQGKSVEDSEHPNHQFSGLRSGSERENKNSFQ